MIRNTKSSTSRKWLQFVNIPFQMGLIIFIGVKIGNFLDDYLKDENLYTIVFSLISVFIALYVVIKSVINMSKDD
jgi:F0F1-type ATP synthase assembly protein I